MQPIGWNHILSQFAGNLPTFITVVLAWINTNARITEAQNNLNKRIDDINARFDKRFEDTNKRFDDMNARFDKRFDDMNKRFDDLKEIMRAEFAALRAEMRSNQSPLVRER